MSKPHPNVARDIEPSALRDNAGTLRLWRRQLGRAAGGRELGCSEIELLPGQASWPLHYHEGNEEAIYMLAGEATLRIGDARVPLRAGDYAALPTGAAHAHQMVNEGASAARYLCISTMNALDIGVYPELGSFYAGAGAAPGGDKSQRTFFGFFDRSATVEYWTGEPDKQD
ncbi:MAG: cupin domain-containing protein [Myxococcales bacterium]|nr:cupin domain-containing protein [Myxococcales bacterium]